MGLTGYKCIHQLACREYPRKVIICGGVGSRPPSLHRTILIKDGYAQIFGIPDNRCKYALILVQVLLKTVRLNAEFMVIAHKCSHLDVIAITSQQMGYPYQF